MRQLWRERLTQPQWAVLVLRAYLGVVYCYAGLSKVAERGFLSGDGPLSMRASVTAVRSSSPIGGLLGPVQNHTFAFGLLLSAAELAVGLGILLGLFTRLAAAGGMLLGLSLWLTISWGADPWYTSADLVYLFAFTPLLLAGASELSLDAWLARARERVPGPSEDMTRRVMLGTGTAVVGGVLLGGAALARGTNSSAKTRSADAGGAPETLTTTAAVPVGGAKKVSDAGQDAYVLQLTAGQFTALSAICPHQGCTVGFVSAKDGFACPCHGSTFSATGQLLGGPATRGLTVIPITVADGDVRTTT